MPSPCRAKPLRTALAALIALALAAPAGAALYKWVDANGRTVYSDLPPPGDVKHEVVGAAPPPANPEAAKDLANREAEFRKRQADRAEEAKKADKSRADVQKLGGFCTQARSQIASLRSVDLAMFRLNEKGERVQMDEGARRAEADRLEALVKERKCPPATTG